jgi:hypothetical protein
MRLSVKGRTKPSTKGHRGDPPRDTKTHEGGKHDLCAMCGPIPVPVIVPTAFFIFETSTSGRNRPRAADGHQGHAGEGQGWQMTRAGHGDPPSWRGNGRGDAHHGVRPRNGGLRPDRESCPDSVAYSEARSLLHDIVHLFYCQGIWHQPCHRGAAGPRSRGGASG